MDKYLEQELLDHMVILCLSLRGTARLFSKVAAPFHISMGKYEDSDFSTFLSTLVIIQLLDYSHPSGYRMVFNCSFDLYVPNS